MAGENTLLGHSIVVEETIGCLCCCPVLAGEWKRLARRSRHAAGDMQQSTSQTLVWQRTAAEFASQPTILVAFRYDHAHRWRPRDSASRTESQM